MIGMDKYIFTNSFAPMEEKMRNTLRIFFEIIQPEWFYCVKSVQIRSFFCPYFPVFRLNTGKYGPEKTLDLDTVHAVFIFRFFEIGCFSSTFFRKILMIFTNLPGRTRKKYRE